jgi:CsoR family transcriptional regulator, copper-sensing transcriptional repressor
MVPLVSSTPKHAMHEGRATEGRAEEMATEMMAAVGRLLKRG